jgi:hypothetical protein
MIPWRRIALGVLYALALPSAAFLMSAAISLVLGGNPQ